MKTNKDIVFDFLTKIEAIQHYVSDVETASRFLHNLGAVSEDFRCDLRSALIEHELRAWRDVFMFGITLDAPERERIKAAAYDRFLAPKYSVVQWMNSGVMPAQWLTADEKAFRAYVDQLFNPPKD